MTRRAVLLLALVPLLARADLFSPGELARAHGALEGLSNCTKCHPEGGRLNQETCLDCHTELKGRVAKGAGFHGRIGNAERECENCHKEHQGPDFQLISWGAGGQKGFSHEKTGWPLKGKHEPVECGKCHQVRLIKVPVITQMLEKQPRRTTFLGLKTKCQDCHFDEHRGQLEGDCDYCHREADWKPAPGFNHDETSYPLKGLHKKVKCEKCHPTTTEPKKDVFPPPRSETFARFSGLDHEGCTDCHKDPHDGRFGPRCTSCHTVDGWKLIRNAAQERGFHDKTRYPLKGEHLDVPCQACHGPFPGQAARFKGLPFARCSDCHVDAHEGQLQAPAGQKAPDCDACHGVEGFSAPRFGLKQHEATRFPLEGAHRVVGCALCHERSTTVLEKVPEKVRLEVRRRRLHELFSAAALDFGKPLDACESCHRDAHQGQFEGRAKGCQGCHQQSSFHELTFQHDRDSKFPLTGKHAQVACLKCHAPDKKGEPPVYRPIHPACDTCHADPHAGQFDPKPCEDCHATGDFKKVKFKHQPPDTKFTLEGRHAGVECLQCHPKVSVGSKQAAQRFRGVPQACEGCHSDFHRGAFKGFEP